MSLLKTLKNTKNAPDDGIARLGRQFGLDGGQAEQLAERLAPAIGGAARQKAEQGGLGTLLSQLRGEAQAGLVEAPERAAEPEARAQGASFLESLFGSSNAADNLAGEAASQTGIDAATVMKFLPALAAMLQGGMQREVPDSEIDGAMSHLQGNQGGAQAGGLGDILGSLMGGAQGGAQGGGGQQGGLGALADMLGGGNDGKQGQSGGLGGILGSLLR